MGQAAVRADISAVTKADPCKVTTSVAHGFTTGNFIRITDLGNVGKDAPRRGMDQIDGRRFKVLVIDSTNFTLKDPITSKDVDSTGFTTYVSGGFCDIVETEFEFEAT